LKSEQGPDVTIIDGGSLGSVVTCQSGEDADSVLDGFTLTNGTASGMLTDNFSNPTVTNCTFFGNSAYHGGGMCNYDHCSPTVTNCTFNVNRSTNAGGGGMFNYQSSNPTVTDCIFTGNLTTNASGGGMLNQLYSDPTVTDCIFSGNSSYYEGGGMCNYDHCSPTVINCIFSGNSGPQGNGGGGMFNYSYSSPTVTNCTFTGNSASYGGGMSNNFWCNSTVTNCIFWNDTPDEISDDWFSWPTVTYCCVQGGYSGTGNIDADPLFVDPGNDDFHLTYASPCIDAGTNSAPSLPATDFEGDPRIVSGDGRCVVLLGSPPPGATVDMGADEYCLMRREKFITK
jgi:hypothetical protein